MDISSIISNQFKYVDLNLILFYTFLTTVFSILLTFEKSRNYITKLKLTKFKSFSKAAAQVAVRSSKKTASTTKKTLYNVLVKTHNNTLKTTVKVGRIGGKLAKKIINPLYYRRYTSDENGHINKQNHGYTNKLSSSLTNTVSTLRRSSSYILNRTTNKLRLNLLERRVRLRTSHRIYNSKVKLYKKLPLRSMSRLWGFINSIDLPVWLRKPIYLTYAWLFNCNLSEMDIEDLAHYKNLSEFFRRKLKPGARIIDETSPIVSPCDGRILYFGKADKGYLEQVKGVNYSMKGFLGEQNWNNKLVKIDEEQTEQQQQQQQVDDIKYENLLKQNPDNELYHCIIYLAPGDYHRFHSPIDWNVYYRRHFPGELFSVNPSVARWLQGLFSLNERVVYYGGWKYGFFSMTPVGATNVGSIKVYFDSTLETNLKKKVLNEVKLEKDFRLSDKPKTENGVELSRGDYFGEFNLGSTIVLVFEAPKDFEFTIKQNHKVKVGQPLGIVN